MRTSTFLILFFLSICSFAEMKLFLDFTLDDKQNLQQLDEALRIGSELKSALREMEKQGETGTKYVNLKSQLEKYEAEMLKVYGIFPGLNYKMVPTSGYIYQLIPNSQRDAYLEKGFKIPLNSPSVMIKNKENKDIECLKVKIKLLQKRESVLQFNQALRTSTSLKQQIVSLEKQLSEKPEIGKKEEIQNGMNELKKALSQIEEKMNERFGVRNEGKYIFEPKTGAVYLALEKEDLKKLSDLKKARDKKD